MAQINELLRREIGTVLLREYEAPEGCFLTIEEVKTSNDIHHAKIFVSVLPAHHGQRVVKEVQRLASPIRKILQRRLSLKTMPLLTFELDDREDRADRIHRLLDAPE